MVWQEGWRFAMQSNHPTCSILVIQDDQDRTVRAQTALVLLSVFGPINSKNLSFLCMTMKQCFVLQIVRFSLSFARMFSFDGLPGNVEVNIELRLDGTQPHILMNPPLYRINNPLSAFPSVDFAMPADPRP